MPALCNLNLAHDSVGFIPISLGCPWTTTIRLPNAKETKCADDHDSTHSAIIGFICFQIPIIIREETNNSRFWIK
ncbi:unnamed protein product [Sphenostylis stenocarpa]|uniref:Uncharacterized protein n=1 Tax=Sphenostylis stenocarpa TaxID=92480 RepID=A0AA86VW31_9FABA|nr:unnamed protein product [Sphenostylis stenocarpa]